MVVGVYHLTSLTTYRYLQNGGYIAGIRLKATQFEQPFNVTRTEPMNGQPLIDLIAAEIEGMCPEHAIAYMQEVGQDVNDYCVDKIMELTAMDE